MYVSSTNTEGDMVILMLWWPYWIWQNANGPNFAHPLTMFVVDLYKLISIERKSLFFLHFHLLFGQYSSWLLRLFLSAFPFINHVKLRQCSWWHSTQVHQDSSIFSWSEWPGILYPFCGTVLHLWYQCQQLSIFKFTAFLSQEIVASPACLHPLLLAARWSLHS